MNLSTTENLLLLAKHPTKGRFITPDLYLTYGIIGAILNDLYTEKVFELENNRLILKDVKHIEDPFFTEIISKIEASKRPRKILYWIHKLAKKSNAYKWMALKSLENKNMVRIEHNKFLFLIPYRKCYLIDSYNRETLIAQLKNHILYQREISNEDHFLLGLLQACGMQKILSTDRSELKIIRSELKQIIKENPIAAAVELAIRQAAAVIA